MENITPCYMCVVATNYVFRLKHVQMSLLPEQVQPLGELWHGSRATEL